VLLTNFIGRLSTAINEYRAGREQLLDYIGNLPDHTKMSAHRAAVAHFENCLLQAHIAITCLNGVGKVIENVPPIFENNDGSDYDRLRRLNNRIKHFDEDVEEVVRAGAVDILKAPVWITNVGLEADGVALTFGELAGILMTHSQDAKNFAEDFFKDAAEGVSR
jgi:hypothetical protein